MEFELENHSWLFQDEGPYHIETIPMIWDSG